MNNIDKFQLKEITENPIKLDFSKCKNLSDVHILLKNKFGFHDYYGANWDALWDLMRDVFLGDEYLVEIYGFKELNKGLQKECKKMIGIFDDIHDINVNFVYTIVG